MILSPKVPYDSNRPSVVVYTDGSCRKNPGAGGYGAILLDDKGRTKRISGAEANTTNNRMELQAAIEALRWLKNRKEKQFNITLYSDSQYLIKGMTRWIRSWQQKRWVNVKNSDQWITLISLSKHQNIQWIWVRGHAGNEYNEQADRLANDAAVAAGYYED